MDESKSGISYIDVCILVAPETLKMQVDEVKQRKELEGQQREQQLNDLDEAASLDPSLTEIPD